MKGLIIKDIMSAKGVLSIFVIGILMMLFYSFLKMDVTAFIVFFIGILVSVNMFEFDVRANWDQLAITLPVKRRDIVAARYIFVAGLIVTALLIGLTMSMVLNRVDNLQEMLYANSIVVSLIFVYVSIYMPIIYKFGAMKGRYLSMLIIVAAAVIGYFISNGSIPEETAVSMLRFLKNIENWIPYLAMGFAAVCYGISLYGSCRIYEKKEF